MTPGIFLPLPGEISSRNSAGKTRMLRKITFLFSFVCLVLMGAMTFSCGSSSISVNPSCSGGPYNVVGNWQMTVTPTDVTAVTGYGAIDSAGLALFFDTSSSTGAGDTLELPH
jgi:hypothetical protein